MKFAITFTALAFTATAGLAESPNVAKGVAALQAEGGRFEAAITQIRAQAVLPDWRGIPAYDTSHLPTDIAEEVERLAAYGNRFEAAIHAILAQHAVPHWTDTDCADETNLDASLGS